MTGFSYRRDEPVMRSWGHTYRTPEQQKRHREGVRLAWWIIAFTALLIFTIAIQ